MINILFPLCLCLLSLSALAEDTALKIVGQYKAVFTSPPRKIPASTAVDAPLLGNGDLLVALGGKAEKLRFHVSKNDLWVMRGDHDTRPQPLARLDVGLSGMEDASYRVEQDLAQAITTGTFTKEKTTVTLETGVAATENLLWIKLSVSGGEIQGRAGLFLPSQDGQTEIPVGTHTSVRNSQGIYRKGNACEETVIRGTDGVQVAERKFSQKVVVPSGATCAMRVVGAKESFVLTPQKPVLIVMSASGLANTPDFRAAAIKRATTFGKDELPAVRQAHQRWWQGFWDKSFVEIPDKLLEQRYYLSHYGMACASRLRGFPPGIFGWNTTDTPMWNGDYHMNYNLVAPFYGLYAANHIEQADPCNDAIIDSLENSRDFCRKQFGFDGIAQRVAHGPKGSLAHLTDAGQKSHASYSCVPLSFRWYATYDLDFARQAYPFVRGVAEFWENYLTFEGGRYVIYKDSAHEQSGADMNSLHSLAFVRMVMNLSLDMSRELKVDAGKHEKWNHILDHLSAYPTITGADLPANFRPKDESLWSLPIFRYTEQGIPWYRSNVVGVQHIYPAGGIGLDSPPELLQRARNQVRMLGRWRDFNGMNSLYAAGVRVGYDPDTILKILHETMAAIGGPNGMISGNPHGVEHFSIVSNTIQEMLLQSHEGTIRFFPCWPRNHDARFGTLRARGAFLINAELKNGTVTGVKLLSEKGRDCTLANPWPEKKVQVIRGGQPAETVEGERFTFKTVVGETLELRAN
ncbi:hypothetical protein OKA05_14840 [Luteolibacter arcticus]|uniref:Uncharacterized protein n=1 Tax=Luteolibacter arcticus TaxID=1581411 RepID=A0ABT3GK04_9BACT|nr:hypothetical protein [Luteolibacter arcticus]MCW1923842.1 hypothetical protein [Luteolibacter arcticus]